MSYVQILQCGRLQLFTCCSYESSTLKRDLRFAAMIQKLLNNLLTMFLRLLHKDKTIKINHYLTNVCCYAVANYYNQQLTRTNCHLSEAVVFNLGDTTPKGDVNKFPRSESPFALHNMDPVTNKFAYKHIGFCDLFKVGGLRQRTIT